MIVDNPQSQKRQAVRELLRQPGAKLLFQPKYSPNLNPVEQVFAKLKHLLRRAAARTKEAVRDAIGALLASYTAESAPTISLDV